MARSMSDEFVRFSARLYGQGIKSERTQRVPWKAGALPLLYYRIHLDQERVG